MSNPVINAYAAPRGWLFADLLRHLSRAGAVASDAPLPDADAWICVRTDEWRLSPDVRRTVVQVHDMWEHDWPADVGALSRCHPDQCPPEYIAQLGSRAAPVRPLGALRAFTPREKLAERFTIGWVGRPLSLRGELFRHPAMLVEALGVVDPAIRRNWRVLLVGEGLEATREAVENLGISCLYVPRSTYGIEDYPRIYHEMDVLVVTSRVEAGPMPLFEALASGVPVITTKCGWLSLDNGEDIVLAGENYTARKGTHVKTYEQPRQLAELLLLSCEKRMRHYGLRHRLSSSFTYKLEDWAAWQVELARGLAR